MATLLDEVDFALAAFRSGGDWQVQELAHDLPAEVEPLAEALRRFSEPGGVGVVALIGIDEDSFVILRVTEGRIRALLSDAGAAEDGDLAASVLEFLGDDAGDDDDDDAVGDLELLDDLGLDGDELADLIDDLDADSDELLSEVASLCGFGDLFDDALDLSPA
jgi:putative tRNA adenosine deaminase-associated protein